MLRRISLILAGGALLCALAGAGAWGLHRYLTTPLDPAGPPIIFSVQRGEGTEAVIARLAEAGLVRTPRLLTAVARIGGSNLRAGEFSLSAAMSPQQILWTLRFGPPVRYRVTLPEGLTLTQTAARVAETGLTSAEAFLALCADPQFVQAQGIPAPNLEGYLFPDTYFFERPQGGDPRPLVEAMIHRFRAATRDLPTAQDPKALHQTVILASIVEKETALPEERPRVAGVYTNRLARGMLLQADPTVLYGLGPTFLGELTTAHLKDTANPYNTYAHPGLPPGPICSPGLAALQAAANPEAHAYLYFVATGDGGHTFSRTLAEHAKAVERYRQRRNSQSPRPRPMDAEASP
ncbi:MAG: endolytic transglycosylase MltG [Desulfomicrobiaceae bacterium]